MSLQSGGLGNTTPSRIRTGFTLDIYGIVIAPDSPLKVGTLGKTIGNANKIVKRGVNWHQK
jgi:hypothetical protein